ncbi:fimbrillin family protein [Prevotella communis]|uniref:fimbrillin family protein n=1 Tax=Prevotella communis TaxID=2913614 RepID=UPI001EDAB650|nr:fimbrillin family protein [Prevotella communis]UKK62619.1 fimbrillin family protein [Prevotella communis]UKK65444.1 fimbrillin family protein [Prevotella communis]
MAAISNHRINKTLSWWTGALLLCASLTACTSDSTIQEEDVDDGSVPMQFSQAVMSAPVRRAASTTNYLTQGFLVSCWKGFGSSKQALVMDKYEVKYKTDPWANLSKWDYVGSTAEGYRKTQIERYWDASAFPYRFYAISPCPVAADIDNFTLTDTKLEIPTTTTYVYQTCNNGVLTAGAEPYMPAQVECPNGSNEQDVDLLNKKVISKDRTQNGATTTYDRYVALPFHHLTSKVRFAIYNNYGKETPANFYIYNIKVKVVSDNFITEGHGYTADLAGSDMLHGSFTTTTKATSEAERLLLQTDDTKQGDLNKAIDREHAYYCECTDGMLQIPQTGIRMTISFDVYGLDYKSDFTSADGHIVYDKATKTIHYTDIAIKDDKNNIDSFDWESNNIYTYVLKVSEFYPLTIDFSAELTPWTYVYGNIETNLEK